MIALLRRTGAALVATVALLGAAPRVAAAHPIHTTLTQLTFDDATHEVRISLRVFADDFSTAVARHARVPATADHRVDGAAAQAYLASVLQLTDRSGRAVPLSWCGARREGNVYFVCLRAVAPAGLDGARVANRCHFELYGDQINIVQATVHGRRQSLMMTRGDAPKPITG